MKKILLKILEPIVLAGMVVFLGFVFLIEVIDLFIVRPIYQKLFKNLSQEEFDVIWGRLYHSYWDGLSYSEIDIDEATLIDSSY